MNLHSPITIGGRALKMFATRLEKLGIFTFEDFLFHLPARYEDYSLISKIGQLQAGERVTIKGQVLSIKNQYLRGARIRTMQKAIITDETGSIESVWFNQPFLIKTLAENTIVSLSGTVERARSGISITSPEYEILSPNHAELNLPAGRHGAEQRQTLHTGRLVPVYPETKGISSKWIRRQIHNIINQFEPDIKEYLPEEIIARNKFPDFGKAIKSVHFPSSIEDALAAKRRLGFDELFLLQMASIKKRHEWNELKKGKKFEITKFKKNLDIFIDSLPFKLTSSQLKAAEEITHDLGSDRPMNRLLQGDVGSGKTVVSAIAMKLAYLNGFQSALMAPTEILANQHYNTLSELLLPYGINVELVTRSKKIVNHEYDILVGTHSVLSEKIKFSNLGLVIIDEQQRFGVEQRGIIREKGENPHLLTMTATPIPRTVALTMYGNLDLSYLSEMPQNRLPIKTWLVPPEKRLPGYEWIRKQIRETESQVFIICPFIEESESMQTVKAASKEYEMLKKQIFPELKLGLLHGKLKSKEKQEVLSKFRDGEFDILVSTPVVEVGIDIPNATIIVIEGAERFGLAQLHQLRGRVGRGDKQSYCLLFTESENAMQSQRLKGMETLHSGAELAELDLKLRGPGNIYGTSQHGIPKLKAVSFSDFDLIEKARDEANSIFSKLPKYPKLNEKIRNITLRLVSPD